MAFIKSNNNLEKIMIQAILFSRNKWTLRAVKDYCKTHNIKYISYRITDKYYRMRLVNPDYSKYNYRIERNYKGNSGIDYIFGF